ncbi:MAG: lysophospholipid acyltransferase family protein [Bacillota bacterium]
MIKTFIWFLLFFLYLFFSLPSLWKAKKLKKSNDKKKFERFLKKQAIKWSEFLLKIAGINIKVDGLKNIDENENIVFVSNHQSNFDIPILFSSLKMPIGFIAKKEIKKIPIINRWMKLFDCVFIDRSDIRQSIKAINKGANNIKKGRNMVIFPEGTRSKDGSLNEFKPGSFKLAQKSKATIIPVAIDGSIDAMKKGDIKIKSANVKVSILKPIELKRDTTVLAKEVKKSIEKKLIEE